MTTHRFEIKAQEYRERAAAAALAAQSCALDRMREQHEMAALRWIALAEAEEGRAASLLAAPGAVRVGATTADLEEAQ